ncbi:unnamed protein product, partial [Staurois parvus]
MRRMKAVYRGLWQIRGLGSSYGRPVICQHPMSKNSTHSSVCERGDLKVAHGSSGGRTAMTHERDHGEHGAVYGPMASLGTQDSVRDLKVAHGRVWRWRQQQWEAVQGPMRDSGPGSSM